MWSSLQAILTVLFFRRSISFVLFCSSSEETRKAKPFLIILLGESHPDLVRQSYHDVSGSFYPAKVSMIPQADAPGGTTGRLGVSGQSDDYQGPIWSIRWLTDLSDLAGGKIDPRQSDSTSITPSTHHSGC